MDATERLVIESRISNEAKGIGAAYLLLIFLGLLGTHRFYLGKTSTGVAQLILFLTWFIPFVFFITGPVLIIWLIIDLVLIPGIINEHRENLRQKLTTEAMSHASQTRTQDDSRQDDSREDDLHRVEKATQHDSDNEAQGDALEQKFAVAKRKRQTLILIIGAALGGLAMLSVLGFLLFQAIVAGQSGKAGQTATEGPRPTDTSNAPLSPDECNPAIQDCARDDFLQALRRFNDDYKNQLQQVSLAAWNPDQAAHIDELENNALDAFNAGSHEAATATINKAIDTAQTALADAEAHFNRAFATANRAFHDQDAELAQQAINKALLVHPDNQSAMDLFSRIAVLPQVIDLLESAHVAEVENRPADQAHYLREILSLDPARTDIASQLTTLDRIAQARQYSAAVVAAEDALSRGDLQQAQRGIERARSIDPGKDISSLQSRLDRLVTEAKLAEALTRARQAREQDDWTAAHGAYQAALALDSSNAEAVTGEQAAANVLSSLKRLQPYLADPLRIGSKNVMPMAQRLLTEIAKHRDLSTHLDQQIAKFEGYLVAAKQSVPVTLLSDGLTDMSVRSVGRVGKHRRATIKLTPGRYQLEGTREGYRSKLVNIEVAFDADQVEIHLVCDEPAA